VKGTLSFHPLDVAFFDATIAPLVAGRKIDPEPFTGEAVRVRRTHREARRYIRAVDAVLAAAHPPPLPEGAGLWENFKARMERLDWRPDPLTRKVQEAVEPELLLRGRPFLIAETSAVRVAETVDRYREAATPREAEAIAREQLERLDPEIARSIVPEDGPELSAELLHRSDLLAALTRIRNLAAAARAGRDGTWSDGAAKRALEVLCDELPWRAVSLHARLVPFWTAADVDGLETMCRAARVGEPEFLLPAWRLFAESCEEFPDLKASLRLEMEKERDIGAFVAPEEVPRLVDFLNVEGARIIEVASRNGEGRACTLVLRKIRECATYAARRGLGYLEASGILAPDLGEAWPEAD
jgi:hypothetical protein